MSAAGPRVLPTAADVSDAAARRVRELAAHAIAARGIFRVAFAGGRTLRGVLERLSREDGPGGIDWSSVQVLQADERAVPPDDPESNQRLIRESLLDPLGEAAPEMRRMPADAADPEQAARDHAREFEESLDLAVLGLGEDGHIASLFPGSAWLADPGPRVAWVTDSPKPPARRMTVTPRTLNEARHVLILATGAGKRAAARAALAPASLPGGSPARLLPRAEWLLDAEAADFGGSAAAE